MPGRSQRSHALAALLDEGLLAAQGDDSVLVRVPASHGG
jgi:hypothetical protein